MPDPTDLYRLDDDVPRLTEPVLLYHLDGFVDAGGAGRLAAAHVMATLEHRVVAAFDIDRLLDYRSRRPAMTYDTDHWEAYAAPELAVHLVHDAAGHAFLMLDGPEPDREWELFGQAVITLVERLGVKLAATAHGIPMGVPHTRPLGVTAHATRPELVAGQRHLFGRVQVPGSAAALIELRLGEAGHLARGFAVHVPHYLAHVDYAPAALTALAALSEAGGLEIPADRLREVAEETRAEIENQISASEEISAAVRRLEQQYDAYAAQAEDDPLIGSGSMPTGDELAAQFERFLAENEGRSDGGNR